MAYVKQTKTESRCRICKADTRDAVEAWILRRATGDTEAGERVTWTVVVRAAAVLIPERSPSESAVRRHAREHMRIVTDEEEQEQTEEAAEAAAEAEADALAVFVEVMGDEWREKSPTPDELLELHRRLYVRQLAEDVKAGKAPRITHDQITRGIAESTKRKTNDARSALLDALTGGISQALTGAIQGELEAENPVEAEFEVIEERATADEPAGGGSDED